MWQKTFFVFLIRSTKRMYALLSAGDHVKLPVPKSIMGTTTKEASTAKSCICILLSSLTRLLVKSDFKQFYSWTDFSLWAVILFKAKRRPGRKTQPNSTPHRMTGRIATKEKVLVLLTSMYSALFEITSGVKLHGTSVLTYSLHDRVFVSIN